LSAVDWGSKGIDLLKTLKISARADIRYCPRDDDDLVFDSRHEALLSSLAGLSRPEFTFQADYDQLRRPPPVTWMLNVFRRNTMPAVPERNKNRT